MSAFYPHLDIGWRYAWKPQWSRSALDTAWGPSATSAQRCAATPTCLLLRRAQAGSKNPDEPLRLRRDRRILELHRTRGLSVGEVSQKLKDSTVRRTLATLTMQYYFRNRRTDEHIVKVFLSYAHADAALAARVGKALVDSGLEVSDPDRDHLPGENWAGEVARALEESEAMVVLLTPAASSSPDVKRNIEYALGAKHYSNRLIPVVVGDLERFPAKEVPWILRRMDWFELEDTETEIPKVEPIAEAILSHA